MMFHSISLNTPENDENLNENSLYPIIIKPRSETIIPVEITNPELKEGIIENQEILEGVYICSSLVKVNKNSVALTSILNTSEKSVKISNIKIPLEPISENNNFNKNINNIDSNRLDLLRKSLRTEHLNKEERNTLVEICEEYNDIFHLDGDLLTCTNTVTHDIPTISEAPITAKTYRYPEIHKQEVNKQITKMLNDDIIRPSTSPFSSPVWVVPKKSDASGKKKWRLVVDYRKLNDAAIGDSYPLPNISDILDQLGHSKYFTTLDLASGFHQIEMSPKDAQKTAFTVPLGHYEYTRMPFGLKNAPATFQRLMNNVLSGLQGVRCFVYIDDIVVYADNLENHNIKLKEVFNRLRNHNLKLQPDKCEFLRREVMYLGHLITDSGVQPDPKKIIAVSEFPVPKNPKDIKSFLGLAGYYRRFIDNFSKLCLPLNKLLRKDVEFNWTSSQQEAFDVIKSKLCNKPILQYPNFDKEFILTTDASNYALGGVLSQGIIPNDLPIAYASRALNKAESNYTTTEKELLAIIWCVKHFRPYLYGRKFKIVTDHKPLKWLFNVKDPGSRLVRWRLKLEEYEYEIVYKPGVKNSNADSLSRIKHPEIYNIKTDQLINNNYHDFLKQLKDSIITYNKLEEKYDSINLNDNNLAFFISSDILNIDATIDPKTKLIRDSTPINLCPQELKTNNIYHIVQNDQNYFYLTKKDNYWDKVNYEQIFNLLVKLRDKLIEVNLNSISLPRISTGLNLKWHKIRSAIRYIFQFTNIEINIYHDNIKKPSESEIKEILMEYHSNPTSGHSGFHRTYNRIKETFKWHNMKNDIKSFIKNCESCQKYKLVRKKHKKTHGNNDYLN